MPLAEGVRFGPYEILAPLGARGMGEVYRARDTRLDRTVAIKVLPSRIAAREDLARSIRTRGPRRFIVGLHLRCDLGLCQRQRIPLLIARVAHFSVAFLDSDRPRRVFPARAFFRCRI